jgi:hypothetical protein
MDPMVISVPSLIADEAVPSHRPCQIVRGGSNGSLKKHNLSTNRPSSYWITSSARRRSDCGIVRPRALAVLRLMTK